MKFIRIVYRITALLLLSLAGLVLMGIYSKRGESLSITQKQKDIRQWWLRKVVTIVGLRLDVSGDVPKDGDSALWVSNHISWLDIPIIGSEGVAFLSKAEIRKWPAIGWLGEKGGTVYIQRGGTNASQIASVKIADKINSGDSVLVFPEATTTNGEDVKRFHPRIFAPALDHALTIQPIAIRYLDEEGKPHPSVVWGDESFLTNLFQVLGEPVIYVKLTFLPRLQASDYSERKHLSEQAHDDIREVVVVN